MAAHRFWGIRYNNTPSYQCGCGQIEMAETPGGANECVGGTAVATGTYGGTYAPARSFDGNPAHNWFQAGGTGYQGAIIGYDFGAGNEKEIHEFRVLCPPEEATAIARIMDFVYSDDGITWTFDWMGYATNWAVGVQNTFTKPAIHSSNRYWGIVGTQSENFNRDFLMSEVGFRDTVGGPNVAVGGTGEYYRMDGGYPVANAFDGNLATDIYAGVGGKANALVYDFGTNVAIVEIAINAADGGNGNAQRVPTEGLLVYSQDGFSYQVGGLIAAVSWAPFELKVFPISIEEPVIHAQQAQNLVIYNIPTPEIRATWGGFVLPYQRDSIVQVTQALPMVVHRGRVANPRLRVWTFTLDGHDFFVLRLGDTETLIYDVYSEQWVDWDSKESFAWRANVGMNWIGAQGLGDTYGSNIVVGDDTFGLLWFLDPEQPYDQNPVEAHPVQQIEFRRIVTSQALATGRQQMPCYAVFLDGDNYGLTGTEFTPGIVLEFSDDQGRNFVSAETLPVNPDITVNNPYSWYSLGQFGSPGRIFRVTDNGVMKRIDSMSMNDDAG